MCLILYYYLVLYLFSVAFLVFQSQKTNLSLLLSLLDQQVFGMKTRAFLPDLYHSFPISSLCRVAPKIAASWLVFPSPCFVFASLIGV